MKKITLLSMLIGLFSITGNSQDTIVFNTAGPNSFTIPGCINGDIEIIAGGAPGGSGAYYQGGNGALIQGMFPVSPGDVIDIVIGGTGPCPGAGTNGGGNGYAAVGGNANYNSCGGGGSTNINLNGTPTIIAGGGGGAGGGGTSVNYNAGGGDGGCAQGAQGGSFFATGGGGGTQSAPGAGGAPWAGVPPGGNAGVGSTGGNGGLWNTASGGGGGGGYFGGGGGGNDGCCTGANAGGGGGGGSSLIPAGVGCIQGGNTGNGFVTIILPVCETTICSGDTAFVDFSGQFPAGATNFTATPAGSVYQTTPGNANIGFLPVDTTVYTITATVGGAPQSITWPVNAVDPIVPDAGLDDSICYVMGGGYPLNGTLAQDPAVAAYHWELGTITTFSGGFGNALFNPSSTVLNPTALINQAGIYEFVLVEEDTNGVCDDGRDTMSVYFSVEEHTLAGTDPSCQGFADGTITVTSDTSPASGNMGAMEYSIDGGTTWQASNVFTGLPAGSYTVISRDIVGCEYTTPAPYDLVDPAPDVLSLVSSDTIICQNGTATQVVSAAGPGASYTYSWTAGTSTTETNVITPTPAGTNMSVDVFATSDLGCVTNTLTLNIDHHQPISLTITPNDSICPGYDASHQVVATGGFLNGSPDYTYSWTANGTPMGDITDMININPTADTEYCVTVSDVCETTPETICSSVIMRRVPSPMFSSNTTWGCNPSTITFTNTTDPQDTDSTTWRINGVEYYNTSPLDITFDEVGLYDVYIEVYSEYGCHQAFTATEYIEIHDVPSPLFYANPNPSTIFDTGISMNNVTPGDSNTYVWNFPGGSPNQSTIPNPSVYYPEGVVGDYPVNLEVTNEWGCSADVTSVVHIVSDVIIYAPNIFTPDGDELNQTWRIYIDGIDIYDFHLTMYNRWGEPVWETYNQIAEWNGNYGSAGLVPDGTYVWLVECKEKSTDKKYEFRGHVTVLK